MTKLEAYFDSYRKEIVGIDQHFKSPYGEKKIIYADWIASGRLSKPIEKQITEVFGPFIGNTHSETSETGALHPTTTNKEVEIFTGGFRKLLRITKKIQLVIPISRNKTFSGTGMKTNTKRL